MLQFLQGPLSGRQRDFHRISIHTEDVYWTVNVEKGMTAARWNDFIMENGVKINTFHEAEGGKRYRRKRCERWRGPIGWQNVGDGVAHNLKWENIWRGLSYKARLRHLPVYLRHIRTRSPEYIYI